MTASSDGRAANEPPPPPTFEVKRARGNWIERGMRPFYGQRGRRQGRITVPDIYHLAAQQDLATRNPVIVIPGIMGSRIVSAARGRTIWGEFGRKRRDEAAEGVAMMALPMAEGVPLDRLSGLTRSDGSLADVSCKFAGIPLRRRVYGTVLSAMGVTSYRDVSDDHEVPQYENVQNTAFEFDYDWRRSLDESAIRLHAYIKQLSRFIRAERKVAGPLRFDIVAHSMGGLILRYYLQYGPQLLAHDGSLPRGTWEGANHIENAVIVASPSGGSLPALERLVKGVPGNAILPTYDPTIIGTMPSLYQLLPRLRHNPLVGKQSGLMLDPTDAQLWRSCGWGLASRDAVKPLERLLAGVEGERARAHVAHDHLEKCLRNARAFHEALDHVPPGKPDHLRTYLFAGDLTATPTTAEIDESSGGLSWSRFAPGDRQVTRESALLDERAGQAWRPRVQTVIPWDHVTFIPAEHLAITRHPTTINNILYLLLEKPIGGLVTLAA